MAKGIPDKEKSEKAIEIAKDFRIKIRECDDAASKTPQIGVAKITENFPTTYKELDTFFQLMSDVPDELWSTSSGDQGYFQMDEIKTCGDNFSNF